jgi:hypothetical protein
MEQLDYLQGAVIKTHSNILRLVTPLAELFLFASKYSIYIVSLRLTTNFSTPMRGGLWWEIHAFIPLLE